MYSTLQINEITVEYAFSGPGTPVIIFLNGFRMPFDTWNPVAGQLSKTYSTLQFNRFGVGKTSRIDRPHTGKEVLKLIENLLQSLNLTPPYILVAHSLGGLFANLFARKNPSKVAGLVFIEGTHPDEKVAQNAFKPPILLGGLSEGLKTIEKLFDRYKYSEDECYSEIVLYMEKSGPFPPIPVSVVTGTKKMPLVPKESFQIHLKCQSKLLELSPDSKQILAHKSGHLPQITETALTLYAIEEMTEKVKTKLTGKRISNQNNS